MGFFFLMTICSKLFFFSFPLIPFSSKPLDVLARLAASLRFESSLQPAHHIRFRQHQALDIFSFFSLMAASHSSSRVSQQHLSRKIFGSISGMVHGPENSLSERLSFSACVGRWVNVKSTPGPVYLFPTLEFWRIIWHCCGD